AVNVMKLGAYDYITKPLFPDEILVTVKKALEDVEKLTAGTSQERTGKKTTASAPEGKPAAKNSLYSSRVNYITGNSGKASELYRQIDLVAPTNFSVII